MHKWVVALVLAVLSVVAVVDGGVGGLGRSSFAQGVADVLLAVVFPAQQSQVVEGGGSALGPVHDVVGFAVGGRAGAAGGLAVLVAHDQRFELLVGRDSRAAPEVENFRARVDEFAKAEHPDLSAEEVMRRDG